MTRKILQVTILTVLVILLCAASVMAVESDVLPEPLNNSMVLSIGSYKAIVNNKVTMVDPGSLGAVYPLAKSGRTLIPLRFVAENFGAKVGWDGRTSTVTIALNSRVIRLTVGKREMSVDNAVTKLDVPAESIKGRTFVPLRALVEALGKKVAYYKGFIIISDQEITLDPVKDKELIDQLISEFNEYGNLMENLVNGGWIAENDGWVYIATPEGIYRSKSDGSEKTKLCNDNAWGLNIVGEWIIYGNSSDVNNIYRIRTNGTQRGQLDKDRTRGSIVVKGDWIYYIKMDNQKLESYLYKMKLDGTNKTKLTDDRDCVYMSIRGNWIYYINDSTLKRVGIDGGSSQQVISDEVYTYSVIDDYIYYTNLDDGLTIYKIRIDGSGRTKIVNSSTQEILVVGDWIYYSNSEDGLKLYVVKNNGTENHKLTNEVASNLNLFNGKVVYQVLDSGQ